MFDPSKLPPGLPVWVTIAAALTSITLAILPAMSKLPGALGSLARTFQGNALRHVRSKIELETAVNELVEKRVEERCKPLEERLSAMDARHADEREEWNRDRQKLLEALEETARERDEAVEERDAALDWIEVAVRSDRARRVWAAENGLELPPPPLVPWAVFLANRKNESP